MTRLPYLLLLFLATTAAAAPVRVSAPPLRHVRDTRSAFSWSPREVAWPQAVLVRVRVVAQHRAQPNPWEVAWVVIGNEQRFVAFVPKAEGWHLEVFDASRPEGERQIYLLSGERPRFPIGEVIKVCMIAWEGGVFVMAGSLLLDWRWRSSAPSWWGERARAGVYVEDCGAEVEWIPAAEGKRDG